LKINIRFVVSCRWIRSCSIYCFCFCFWNPCKVGPNNEI